MPGIIEFVGSKVLPNKKKIKSRVEPGIRVSPQRGQGLNVSIWQPKNCFSFLPFSNAHCFRHPVRFQREKVQKVAKTPGQSVLWRRASPAMPHHSVCVRYCVLTNATDLTTVTLIPGRCFRSRGGGGIGFYNNREEEPNFSVFPESLGPKGAIGVVFRSMHPLRRF